MHSSHKPWLIAGLAFIVLGFSRGLHSSFGVFNVALLKSFGWSRGATAGIFSVVLSVDALLSPVVGYLLDCWTEESRGGRLFGVDDRALFQCPVTELWELYLYFGLVVAIGITFMGMAPHVFIISEWFSSNRATAIGFVYAGTGVGIMLLAPLSEWLISTYGWARTLEAYSLFVLIALVPVVGLFYQHGPYGEKLRQCLGRKQDQNQWTARLALQSLQFWLLFLARIGAACGTTVIVTHQVAHVVEVGYNKFLAASLAIRRQFNLRPEKEVARLNFTLILWMLGCRRA
jgi:hypothetical protein